MTHAGKDSHRLPFLLPLSGLPLHQAALIDALTHTLCFGVISPAAEFICLMLQATAFESICIGNSVLTECPAMSNICRKGGCVTCK